MRSVTVRAAVTACGIALAAGQAFGQDATSWGTETVYYDYIDVAGRLAGGQFEIAVPLIDRATLRPPPGVSAVTLLDSDNPVNRLDLVLVGDGYQAGQLGTYAAHAQTVTTQLFNQEPFKTYAPLFTVHRVDVISIDSGVDNDPVQGISKNTALDMGFWCSGIERALCVSVSKALQHAAAAPYPPDQVLALANSTKYGGVGYPGSNLGTVSGGNFLSTEIAIHELGHSLGNLADEYEYDGPLTYTGPERPEPNVSIRNATQMAQLATKWHQWLNINNPQFDGLVSTYEGAHYSQFGIYRPTVNSKMRELGRPFNLPSVEALIVEIYKEVNPIDASAPENEVLSGTSVPFVDPVDPVNNPLSIQWSLDGVPIPGATGTTLNIASLGLAPSFYALSVKVVDNTPWVKNQALRTQWLTDDRYWSLFVTPGPCYPDCTLDGTLTVADFGCFQTKFVAGDPYADCNGAGGLTVADFGCFQTKFVAGCP